jgi:hypothetical protein
MTRAHPTAGVRELVEAGQFLVDRIGELDWTDFEQLCREWAGHVEPPLSRFTKALRLHEAAEDGQIEYEVWQQDAFGDGDGMVAGSTSLADTQHYAAVYSQDAPAWVVEVTRRRVAPPVSASERRD